jgi:exopolysaccharide biosynthesis polyprenyl glycosylphosphotransferase
MSTKEIEAALPLPLFGQWKRSRGRRFSQTVLVCGDLAVLLIVSSVAFLYRFNVYENALSREFLSSIALQHLAWLLLYTALVLLFCHTHKLYHRIQIATPVEEMLAIGKAVGVSTILLAAFIFLSGAKNISRLVISSTVVLSAVSLVAWRNCRRWYVKTRVANGHDGRTAIIVGMGQEARALQAHLAKNKQLGYRVKGFLTTDGHEWPRGNSDILGNINQLWTVTRSHFVDVVFVTGPVNPVVVKSVVVEARNAGLEVRIVPDLYGGLAFGAPVEHIGHFPTLLLHEPPMPAAALMVKRIIDVIASTAALILCAPLFAIISFAVAVDSRGPVFHNSTRIGKKGRTFTCYKFRTMVEDAEKLKSALLHLNEREGLLFKIANDPRITRLGRFLRKYSLDELPQFWNVLKGDMSLVGPRPPLADEYEQYSLEHLRRLDVRPGITGLWQVRCRREPSFQSYLGLDLEYIENWNLWLDVKILFRTVGVVLAGTGQ